MDSIAESRQQPWAFHSTSQVVHSFYRALSLSITPCRYTPTLSRRIYIIIGSGYYWPVMREWQEKAGESTEQCSIGALEDQRAYELQFWPLAAIGPDRDLPHN